MREGLRMIQGMRPQTLGTLNDHTGGSRVDREKFHTWSDCDAPSKRGSTR